jgi:uncharacterized surface protein with fasciclin (FAS1) repeats
MTAKSRSWKVVVPLLAVLASLCLVATPARAADKDIVETAAAAGQFKTLVKAVQAAGLVDALKGKGPFTVFAPTDEAFDKLPDGVLADLLKPENKPKLVSILTYHVVPGRLTAKDVVAVDAAETLSGATVPIEADGGVTVGGARVVKTDIEASNGVIHVIDSVMLPRDVVEVAADDERFSTLVAAVKAAGLVETLKGDGPFTVFAPTNEAFAKLPDGTAEALLRPENRKRLREVLLYHVVPGRIRLGRRELATAQKASVTVVAEGTLLVNNAEVLASDVVASNGVIHVIDTVLIPPAEGSDATRAAREVIELAIDRGVPLYNSGRPGACRAVYEVASVSLLRSYPEALTDADRNRLRRGLREAAATHSDSEAAWALRRALDDVYLSLRRRGADR